MRSHASSPQRYTAIVRTPFAMLGIATDAGALTQLTYLAPEVDELRAQDAIAARAAREIERYLDDPDFKFTVPLSPGGTLFQQRVWQAIRAIPRAQSRTYGEIARSVVSAPRAVGQACGANRIALIIPCHRVVGSQGALGGFMNAREGDPLAVKRWLLTHEGYRFGA
jgi:methylated-DNA-[protein]-cysteine S-methyltransferase